MVKPMYTSTFTFAKSKFDEQFYALDEAISQIAKSVPGYIGEESWESATTGLTSNVYYWETLDAIQQLMRHPVHIKAKALQSKWLNGYQVVIGQVVGTYGNGGIQHPLSGRIVKA